MARKISIKGIKTKAWATTSRYIRQRDKGVCQTCGKVSDWKEMDCGHYRHNSERNQSLGGNALWWDERNLFCQCFRCNRLRSGEAVEAALFLERKYGQGILQEINKLWNTAKKWTVEEIQQVITKYEDKITQKFW